tara:strand:+ start:3657 stop:4526 length:870 start_codon:yes stop_codon:yes gene_type:complete
MAVTYWTGGGVDDAFGTAGNWSAGLPGAGDTAIINDTSNAIVAETYATTFEELRVGNGFTGSLGVTANGALITLGVTCTSVVIDTGAAVYVNATADLVTIERTGTGDDAVRLTGDVTTLRVLGARGTVVLGEATALALDDLEILGSRTATVEVQSLTTLAAAPISMDDGRLEFRGMAATYTGQIDCHGGRIDLYAGSYTTATFEIWGSVVVNDYRDANSTIGTVNMFGGTWDAGEATADLLTITTLKLYTDATFDERNGLLNFAYTNGVHFAGAGTFHAATARKITEQA